jgi:hypothetical protein
VILARELVSLSAYASQNQKHLPPHDTINAVVQTADGIHGIVELSWGAPVPSRSQQAHEGISVTGQDGWLWVETVDVDGKRRFRITVFTVTRDEHGRDIGEEKHVFEEHVRGIDLEFASFFKALDGNDDGFGSPLGALKDVAFIQAGLNSNGQPVDLVKLVQG